MIVDPNESHKPERLQEQIQSLKSLPGVMGEVLIARNQAVLEARLRARYRRGSYLNGNVEGFPGESRRSDALPSRHS